ncbi:hypothetical protein A3A93_02800 [Candidatus Roizmanbacteria bacterium RIFCSPLOWO2_01_FULL_38_12]|uniref:Acetolactate synthase n=1 Tax=Candidatus Roizmanbacteria bacterium RIFCSPLOWO2_01_FULL_38_12 TaxID=1802061 RepID=A0A1F7IUN3_9BACT|nr:MAG: hypothetical protein A2861_01875 [Candidatus Roizmanbacteria bacterium RIFCSPHIGHO2_01_FULL_38_15]OGK34332.1 MAG: hypothetical protein A3F59_04805 [Candidatus Roizmanbacteria bacterium RIFCSPHIGHO2_12_FULL_38_13]OGK47026.1 MAG: hypothetical protein A3A93_02800 [Candidatus Roizmanbacteria bacterium RIFCSPLOWO2_01_FULL_38_12]
MNKNSTVSDYIFSYVKNLGVKHVFMISGGGSIFLVDALGRNKKIHYVCNHHEQASAIAAESYARITNNIGVCLVTTGPGSTNTLTGLIGAWLDSIPVLYISGQIKKEIIADYSKMRQLGDQEINIIDMVKSVTKYAVTVMNPQDIRYHLDKAVYMAKTGRPGPVWLNIPLDVQGAIIDTNSLKSFNNTVKKISNDKEKINLQKQIRETLKRIAIAKRPVMLVGNGVRLAGAQKQLLTLIKKLKIPVLTSFTGYDLVGSDNTYFYGRPGTVGQRAANFILQNSDLLLVLGSRLNIRMVGYNFDQFAPHAYKIIVDIDKAELQKKTIKTNFPIHANVKNFIEEMNLNIREKIFSATFPTWLEACDRFVKKYPQVLPEYWKSKKYVDIYCFIDTLSNYLKSTDAIAVSDGAACVCPYQGLQFPQGVRIVINSGCAAMGYGLPAALGICFARNKKETICIEGDGSLQLNIQELQTVVHHKLPIKIFVLNNKGYVSIRLTQKNLFSGRYIGSGEHSGVSCPDSIKIAKAYGIMSYRISNHSEMKHKLKKVFAEKGPVICEILLSSEMEFLPKAASKRMPNGKFVSRPLHDMYPFLPEEEVERNMIK